MMIYKYTYKYLILHGPSGKTRRNNSLNYVQTVCLLYIKTVTSFYLNRRVETLSLPRGKLECRLRISINVLYFYLKIFKRNYKLSSPLTETRKSLHTYVHLQNNPPLSYTPVFDNCLDENTDFTFY